jgi:hypothetical protein
MPIKWLLGAVCVLVVGCGGGEEGDDFKYDGADVQAALFGSWQGTWLPANGDAASDLELEIRAPDEAPLGSRCGDRTLGSTGLSPQCTPTSSMSVSGTVSVADGSDPVDLDGTIFVPSLILSEAWVSLTRDGAPLLVNAQWTDAEGWVQCTAQGPTGETLAACTFDAHVP